MFMRIESSFPFRAMGNLRGPDERHARTAEGRSGKIGSAGRAEPGAPRADGPGGHALRGEDLALASYRPSRLALTRALLDQATAAVFMELAAPGRARPGQTLDGQV